MPKPHPSPMEFTATIRGKDYRASYTVQRGLIEVVYWGPDAERLSKATQLGGHAAYPETLARILLRELVNAR